MNALKRILSNISAIGATLSLGVLAFSGMMLIVPSLPLAAVTFFLAVAIEGAVYRQNIFEAMKRLGNQEVTLARAIARRELNKLEERKENTFLKDYFNQKEYLHELEENLASYNDENKAIAEKEMYRVQNRLSSMEDLFIKRIRKEETGEAIIPSALLPEMTAEELNGEIKTKNRYMHGALFVSLASGLCAGFVSLSAMHTCLIAAGLSLSVASLVALPVVGFAALGYMFMMYRTITDMIQNDTLKKWGEQFRTFWVNFEKDNVKHYLKIVGVAALVALAIVATIATAGTWWYLAREGAKLATFLPSLAAGIISAVSWTFMLVPNFLFNLVNAIKSINKLPGLVNDAFDGVWKNIVATWKDENIFQFINPFRIIKKVIKAVVFVGHLVSIAVSSDQSAVLDPIVSTSVGVLNEAATDIHCIAGHSCSDAPADMKQEAAHDHSHGCHSHDHHHHAHDHPHNDDHHSHDDDHHHQHGDFVLNKIDMLFNYLSSTWDWVCSNDSWQDAKEKFMPTKPLPQVKPLSDEWVEGETESKITVIAQGYDLERHSGKSLELRGLLQDEGRSDFNRNALGNRMKDAIQEGKPLSTHRSSFCLFGAPPKSQQFLQEMLDDRSLQLKGGRHL